MRPVAERFWEKVDKSGECWVWTAHTNSWGYGRFGMRRKTYRAHAVAYELCVGPVPEGMHVLHHCDNPPCVRPEHLWLGTDADNAADMVAKGRSAHGSRNGHAKLTEAMVREIRELYAAGEKQRDIAQRYGIRQSTVSVACRGKTWGHVG